MTTDLPVPAGGALDDAALLARHVDGDADAFAELVARHRDRLWAVAVRTLGNPDDAADALQDALVRAFRRAETFRGDAAVTTWLHRVVVNACLDQLRRQRARPVDAADPLEDPVLAGGVEDDRTVGSSATDPAAVVLRREQQAQVASALASLPLEQRAALVLVDMEGWSVQDAAEMLGCAPGTVKSRCSRGRARLAPLLQPLRAERSGRSPRPDTAYGNQPAAGDVSSMSGGGALTERESNRTGEVT